MRAGLLRHTVSADEPTTVPDGEGGHVTAWIERMRFKAAIEPITGREQMRAQQVLANVDSRVRTRWSVRANGIRATWRLRHGPQIYDIVQPPIEKLLQHRELEILVRTGLRYFPEDAPIDQPSAPPGAIYFGGQLLFLNDNLLVLS